MGSSPNLVAVEADYQRVYTDYENLFAQLIGTERILLML